MRSIQKLGLAAFVSLSLMLVPAAAHASRTATTVHSNGETYHDRTPHVHTHGSHPHHQQHNGLAA